MHQFKVLLLDPKTQHKVGRILGDPFLQEAEIFAALFGSLGDTAVTASGFVSNTLLLRISKLQYYARSLKRLCLLISTVNLSGTSSPYRYK